MPTPLTGFDVINDPKTDNLGWHVPLNLQSFGGLLDVINQTDFDFELWANDTNFLGIVPAWTAYVKINMHGLYTYVNFRPSGTLYAQQVVSETVSGSLYQFGEPAPSTVTIALPRQSQQIRQIRNIAVPMGLDHWYNRAVTLTTGLNVVIDTFIPTAAQIAHGRVGLYFYYAWVDAAQALSVQTNAFNFAMQWRDAGGGAVGGPFDLYVGRVTVNTTQGDHATFRPMAPLAAIGGVGPSVPAGATKVDFIFYVSASTGGNTTASIGAIAFIDTQNLDSRNGGIGSGVGWSPAFFEGIGVPFPYY